MTGVIPELAVVTTSVGAVMIRLGVTRGLLQAPQSAPQVSVLRPSDRPPRLNVLRLRGHEWPGDRSFTVVRPVPIASVS